jgi:orotidine-5'-phosphate decarboxylase
MKEKLCLALDMDWQYGQVVDFLRNCRGYVSWVKIGYHMIYKGWAYALAEQAFSGLGLNVFLDTKIHDIPNTVKLAATEISKKSYVDMFNLHIQGGKEMMLAAVENKGDKKVIGVTHLTSAEVLPVERIIDRVNWGKDAGLDGVVCSGMNLKKIKEKTGMFCVVPGIRLTAPAGDQKQIITPKQAIDDGADLIVLGREVYGNDNPQQALLAVIANIEGK